MKPHNTIDLPLEALAIDRSASRISLDTLFPRNKLRSRELAEFCTQLSVMLQSGVQLHRALEILNRQAVNKRVKTVIGKISKHLQRGSSFAKALSLQQQSFDPVFIATAEVGEETGKLGEVLAGLADHLEKLATLKRKFVQAMTYPALVVSVALGAVLFLLLFIVPTFAEMFRSFQVELPDSTQIVLHLSSLVTEHGGILFVCVLLGIAVLGKGGRTLLVSKRIQGWLARAPLFGSILVKNQVARICRTLGTLLHAQVPLVDALGITQRTVTFEDMRWELANVTRLVRQGKTVAEPLVGSKFFPPMVAQMIAVGEETSELDRMLLKVADYYEKELDAKIESLSSVIEPVIILLLGGVVAAILISMYLPMFELVNVVGGVH